MTLSELVSMVESTATHLHFSLATGSSASTRYYNDPIWDDEDDGIDYVSSILVTFDPDGGQCDTEHFGYGTGETYEWLPTPTDTSGRTFSGWYTENGTKVEAGDTVGSTSMTLTARWENATVSVTYDLNGGSWSLGTSGTLTVTNGKITLHTTVYVKTGYNFAGWANGGVTYQPGAEVSVADGTTAMTFEAAYTPKPVAVNFNASNGLPAGMTEGVFIYKAIPGGYALFL